MPRRPSILNLPNGIGLVWPLALALAAAGGQDPGAWLYGTVTDSTQASIPGAAIRLVRPATNQAIETKSDQMGRYSIGFLVPGEYTMEVSRAGFKGVRQERIVLGANESANLAVILEVGEIADRVSVSSQAEKLQTSTASRSYRWEPEKIQTLPLIGRQAYSLIGLTPGVVFTQEQFGTQAFVNLRGFDSNTKFVINGGREGTNQFLLNGAPVSLLGAWQYSPSVDAIEEFRVLTNTYDSQYGRTGGGTVTTALRSGTNTWRGSVFEYFHNAVFDANSKENNTLGAPRGKHNTHQFGGVLGGPIRKDRDFVFLSYEGFREVVPSPIVSDTPPLDLRDGQHFGAYRISVFDPNSVRRCRVGVDTPPGVACFGPYLRQPFPGNKIPKSRISPVGLNILSLYPAPNGPGQTQNYLVAGNTADYTYDQPLVHWDHAFSDKDRLSAVAAAVKGRQYASNNGFPSPADTGNQISERLDQNYIADWTHIVSASTVIDARVSFGRFTQYFPANSQALTLTAAQLGISNVPYPPTVPGGGAPAVSLQSYSSIIGATYSWNTQNQWDIQPNVIHTRGRHVLHLGVEAVRAAVGSSVPGAANGQFSFNQSWSNQFTRGPRSSADGSSVADLLLGLPASGYIDYNGSFYRTWPYFAMYVQDYWKVASKLTVNLGLRYDAQIPIRERYNRLAAGFDLTVKNPLSDEIIARWKDLKTQYDLTNPKSPYPDPPAAIYGGRLFTSNQNPYPYRTDWTDIQPRIGLAWNFLPKTVFRAGAGIFYRTAGQMNQSDGFNQRTNYAASLDGGVHPSGGLTGAYSLRDPFPSGIFVPSGSSLGYLTNIGRPITFDGGQRPIPRTYEYSAGFQRELPWNVFAEASYVGSQTVHDSMATQYDNPSPATYQAGAADPASLTRRLPNPFSGILPSKSDLGGPATITAFDLLRPYPAFNGITETTNPAARYRYDSLQVLAEKRILDSAKTGVFSFLMSYTFSKSFAMDHRLNAWNLAEKPVHEVSSYDKPHTFALTGLWELPIGWGRKWLNQGGAVSGFFLNGWAVDWILTYSSGYPVTVPDAVFTCASYQAGGEQSPAHWFNNDRSCYQARPLYSLRTAPDRFSNIRNPAAAQLHASAEKTFWLSDTYALQLRGEAFNVTNTPVLGAPVTDFKDPRFGQLPLQQANFPRFIQLAAKIVW